MEIRKPDYPNSTIYQIRGVNFEEGFGVRWYGKRKDAKERREGILRILNEADDEGHCNFEDKDVTIKHVVYSGTGYSGVGFTFNEFIQMGRPMEIERRRISIYKPIRGT